MARKLKNIKLNEISLVDKAANQKDFLFFKARGDGRGTGGNAQGDGGAKYCVCSECGYSEKHEKTSEGKSVPCTKIKCPECGASMQGSDTKMLKKKKNINIVIDSDGTIGGTAISVNKEKIEDVNSFSFYFYGDSGGVVGSTNNISCSYSKAVQSEDGFSRSETYYLSKGAFPMNKEYKKALDTFFGEDHEVDFEKAEDAEDIIKSLATFADYKAEFPDDLKKAAGILAKQACMTQKVEKSEEGHEDEEDKDKDEVAKSGAKLSKDTLKKVTDALSALKSIMPEITEKSEKSVAEKTIADIEKKLETIEESNASELENKTLDALKKLSKRLGVVEKSTGLKKSVDGQDDTEDDDSNAKWPSFGS